MTPNDLVLTPRGVRFQGLLLPAAYGRGGISQMKREGDGATPTGVHHIVGVLYRPDRTARPITVLPCRPIGPNDIWSDDVTDPAYNQLLTRRAHPFRHERLRRADPLYDLVLVTDWNWPRARPGRGSAIFIHQWRRKGCATDGCIAFDRSTLRWVSERLIPGSRLIVPAYSG